MYPFIQYLGRRFFRSLPLFILLPFSYWLFGVPVAQLPIFLVQLLLFFLILYRGEYEATVVPTAPVSTVGIFFAIAAGYLIVLLDNAMGTGDVHGLYGGYFTGCLAVCLYLFGRHVGMHRGMTPVAKKIMAYVGVSVRRTDGV